VAVNEARLNAFFAKRRPAPGAQAGAQRLPAVVVDQAGFTRFRRASETPFNIVLEARP
jgi:hypothetical protein